MKHSNELINNFENGFFTALPFSIHAFMKELTSSDIMDTLEHLAKHITGEIDADDSCDRYISMHDMAYCIINLLFTEIKYALYTGEYSLGTNSIEMFGDDVIIDDEKPKCKKIVRTSRGNLDIDELRRLAESINASDKYEEYLDFTKDIDEIVNLDFEKSEMGFELLSYLLDGDYANLIVHMLYYMHDVDSEEELKRYDQIDISQYTADKLKEEIGRSNSSIFCYCFLDVASDDERRGMYHYIDSLKSLEGPRSIILNISHQDMYLSKWIAGEPVFPYLTYKLLTDYDMKLKFLEETEYNESNIISAADLEREELAPLIPRALAGDAEAQHELGIKYVHLSDATIHQNKAKYWLGLAANAGLVKSQIVYGALLYNDDRDAEAIEWYKKAAETGNSEAQYRVGIAYADGIGVEESRDEAIKWLTLAVEQNHFLAKFRLDQLIKK